jgi:hypothetical protein
MATHQYTKDFCRIDMTCLPIGVHKLLVDLDEYAISNVLLSDNDEDNQAFYSLVTNKGTFMTYDYKKSKRSQNFPKSRKLEKSMTDIKKMGGDINFGYHIQDFGQHVLPDDVVTKISDAIKELAYTGEYKPRGDLAMDYSGIYRFVMKVTGREDE